MVVWLLQSEALLEGLAVLPLEIDAWLGGFDDPPRLVDILVGG